MEAIDQVESEEMRHVLSKFYGPVVNTWTINYGVYEVLGRLIAGSEQCTRAMHLVPRPWDLTAPAKWAQRQVRKALVRYLNSPEGQHYVVCMKGAARNFRSEFELAQLGL
ncbi:hypothetical protein [Denitromonas iodatirespirans]|uniref:Uncharacterized protein n=2 Tax=Rhodocyclales TaxID=206389 RepID=A0A944H5Y9_DENI1|nr:hypothetical protein [Denitromonas iodatirespirans]MBT0959618.1 hypothetical protein [Denitromonas iodatirespirans]